MLLSVPLVADKSVDITITIPESVVDGGAPVVTEADAEGAMSALLAVAAGQELPAVKNGKARLNVAWVPDRIADHAGVTGSGLPATLSVSGKAVPDVVVGACWPAVFAVLGAAKLDSLSVIEGMLDLVHLDHTVDFVGELPSETSILVVNAEVASVLDTDLGRVVEVKVEVGAMLGEGLDAPAVVTMTERFAIRGRTGAGELADPARAGASRLSTPRVVVAVTRRSSRRSAWAPSLRFPVTTTRFTPPTTPLCWPASEPRSCTACGSPPQRSRLSPQSTRPRPASRRVA